MITKLTRGEVKRNRIIEEVEEIILEDFGMKCEPHEEECVICNVYKALEELKRHYGKKITSTN